MDEKHVMMFDSVYRIVPSFETLDRRDDFVEDDDFSVLALSFCDDSVVFVVDDSGV